MAKAEDIIAFPTAAEPNYKMIDVGRKDPHAGVLWLAVRSAWAKKLLML